MYMRLLCTTQMRRPGTTMCSIHHTSHDNLLVLVPIQHTHPVQVYHIRETSWLLVMVQDLQQITACRVRNTHAKGEEDVGGQGDNVNDGRGERGKMKLT